MLDSLVFYQLVISPVDLVLPIFFHNPRGGPADLQELADLGIPAPMPATSSKVLIWAKKIAWVTLMIGYENDMK